MYKIVAHSYPNNEIRVTMSSVSNGRDPFKDTGMDPIVPDSIAIEDSFSGEEIFAPLSLVSNSQTERSSAGFGALPVKPTKFGTNAKRHLLREGGAMESECPPEECIFFTGTLPGSTESSFRAIAEWSGYIVHRLKSWVGNYARGKYDFYVWEYQKRGALHLHYCVHVPNGTARGILCDKFHEWWVEILHRVGELSRVDMFRKNSQKTHLTDTSKVRAVAEICRKSPSRYLAKYLSKSATPKRGNSRFFTPSRWWGTSRPLKLLAKSLTKTVEIAESGVNAIRRIWEDVSHYCDTSESVTYSYRHKVGIGETYVCYPKSDEDKECLMSNLMSLAPQNSRVSISLEVLPSQELKLLKISQMRVLSSLLHNYPNITPGLRSALERHLNWMEMLTPSKSQEPLTTILAWAAYNADIVSLCRYTPIWHRENQKLFSEWADCLERNIEVIACYGWL